MHVTVRRPFTLSACSIWPMPWMMIVRRNPSTMWWTIWNNASIAIIVKGIVHRSSRCSTVTFFFSGNSRRSKRNILCSTWMVYLSALNWKWHWRAIAARRKKIKDSRNVRPMCLGWSRWRKGKHWQPYVMKFMVTRSLWAKLPDLITWTVTGTYPAVPRSCCRC